MSGSRVKRAYTRRERPMAVPEASPGPSQAQVDQAAEQAAFVMQARALMDDVESAPDTRPVQRPELRDESPLERAKRRSAELRGHLGDMDEGTDEFFVDVDTIPDGWSYEWKRHLVLGAPDHAYDVSMARRGWEAVPTRRHPEMMPRGTPGGNPIERKGMVLMERPKEITDEARDIELRKARNQVRQKEAQLRDMPSTEFADRNDPRARANIKKGYSPVEIPADAE